MPRTARQSAQAGETTVTIKEAAKTLGVSEVTLRRWDEAGSFKALRHPINGYRLYRLSDLAKLKRAIEGRRSGTR